MEQIILSLIITNSQSLTEIGTQNGQVGDHNNRLPQGLYAGTLKQAIMREISESVYDFFQCV